METGLLIALIVLAILGVIVVMIFGRGRRPIDSNAASFGLRERERAAAAQVEVEEHDIEEMIEARNALRRRIGKPPIGEELAEDARRETGDEP